MKLKGAMGHGAQAEPLRRAQRYARAPSRACVSLKYKLFFLGSLSAPNCLQQCSLVGGAGSPLVKAGAMGKGMQKNPNGCSFKHAHAC